MPKKDDRVYLGHMLDMAEKVCVLIGGKTRTDFDDDEVLRLALAHLIQVVGEAGRHVSSGFQDAHPEIPWSSIIGMRHKVVHDYMDLDEDVLWATVTRELGPVVERLREIERREYR